MSRGRFDGSDFLRACRMEPHRRVPVWFMRQAGRSLPEYRAVRGAGSILDAIADPDRAAEITLQPVRRYGVDAAILFSDIVVPAHAVGFGVDVVPGTGPVIERPFAARGDLDRLRPLDPGADTPYVIETVRRAVAALEVPLIGFAGAPFTVASYLVEGGPSPPTTSGPRPSWSATRRCGTISWTASPTSPSPRCCRRWRQERPRCSCSTAGPGRCRRTSTGGVSPPTPPRVLEAVGATGVPRIHFGVGTGELLDQMGRCGAEVVGVDFRVPIDAARQRVGPGRALQGNLDPAVVLAGESAAVDAARAVLAANGGHPGFIFNLGHGVLPGSDPDVLARVVRVVHDEGQVLCE